MLRFDVWNTVRKCIYSLLRSYHLEYFFFEYYVDFSRRESQDFSVHAEKVVVLFIRRYIVNGILISPFGMFPILFQWNTMLSLQRGDFLWKKKRLSFCFANTTPNQVL